MSPQSTDAAITFPEGLPGFEASRQFVLIASPGLEPYTLVQGLGDDSPAFLAIDPRRVQPDYDVSLDARTRARLGADDEEPLLWLALVSLSPDGAATVNLRAPLVISPRQMRGLQWLRDDPAYALASPLKAA